VLQQRETEASFCLYNTGNWLLFVFAAVDRVINDTVAYDKIRLITLLHYNIYLTLQF